jgi:hypothetical protein
MKRDKLIEEARTRYKYAVDQWAPIFKAMREDLRFSDPTDMQQWPDDVRRQREDAQRPCLTFDQTGQFVRQVINQARRNRPAMKFLPVDDQSDPEMAEVLQGLARQTEYESRADVAYITALDHATRGGLGWFRLITEAVKGSPVKGQLCAKIMRVTEPESVKVDPDFQEPDGSDMRWGFVEATLSKDEFARQYPKAKAVDFDSEGWFDDKHVRVVEYFRVVESKKTRISVLGQQYGEDEYWSAVQANPELRQYPVEVSEDQTRKVEWYKLSGEEVLEEKDDPRDNEFPSEYVPIFPVLGNEQWVDGKRMLSGAIRAARDPQIAYNYERNSGIEAVAVGPKAPWIASIEAIDGHENSWKQANSGNIAVLPYNSVDEQGNPITAPQRIAPAGMSQGWAMLDERSKADIQSALGMYNASFGNNPNSQSGRAVLALQDKADIGTYHYLDNLALSMSHCGRVLTQVWPAIYDTAQIVRILGEDDETSFVTVDPNAPAGYSKQQGQNGKEQIIINPNAGRYDVRVTTGPAYATRQAEAAAEIGEMVNGNPQMMSLLGDVWVKMRNIPNGDVIAKRFKAMLPPQVIAAEQEEDGQQPIPPEVRQVLQQAQQEIQQLQQALQEAQSGMQTAQLNAQVTLQKAQIDAESRERIAAMSAESSYDVQELKGLIEMLKAQIMPPPQLSSDVSSDMAQND